MKKMQAFVGFLLTLLIAGPSFAMTIGTGGVLGAKASSTDSASTSAPMTALQKRINTAKERADQEIQRRINSLNELTARIQEMIKLSAEQKSALRASINAQITALNDLKNKIAADTELEVLKEDIKSITSSYRIYLLIIPQAHIMVAAEKLKVAADASTALATKLSARIDSDGAAGKDVSKEKTALADMQEKIADAIVQADAAISLVAGLTPDEGDKTKQEANTKALKDARGKIKAGLQDIVAAREDARKIVKGLTGSANVNATASSTTP
jgi:hypothetical protein